MRSFQSLSWPEKLVFLSSSYQKYNSQNTRDTFLPPVKRISRLYSLHLRSYQRYFYSQIKIALWNLFLGIYMLRLIKYSNPILPPQYCLVRPLCLYLSSPSRRRRPSRDALYARNKSIKQMRSHRVAKSLHLGSKPRKFFLPLSPHIKESV